MRRVAPVAVMAAAMNRAAATRARAVLAKPEKASPRPALVPIKTRGLAGFGERPSRKAISAAMITAETA